MDNAATAATPKVNRPAAGRPGKAGRSAAEVVASPEFKALVKRRWTVSMVMLVLLFVSYYGYVLLVAGNREFVSQKIDEATTLGDPAGGRRDRLRLAPHRHLRGLGQQVLRPRGRAPPERDPPLGGSPRKRPENTAMQTSLGSPTASSIFFFFLIVALTLVITYWAATTHQDLQRVLRRRPQRPRAPERLRARRRLHVAPPPSWASPAWCALKGYDGMIYATGWLVGWPALMFLIAEPLRNLGKYTFADVVAFRLRQTPGAHRRGHRRHPDRALLHHRADGRLRAT